MNIMRRKWNLPIIGVIAACLLAPSVATAHVHPNGRPHYHGHHRTHHHHQRFDPDRPKVIVRPFGYHPFRHSPRHPLYINGVCTEHKALAKAISYGIADPRIVDFGHRIIVDGYRFHTRVRIVMNNVSGCPIARF